MTDPTIPLSPFAQRWAAWAGSISAGSRYLVVFGGGIVTALGLAGVDPATAQHLLDALATIGNGLSTFMTTVGPAVSAFALAYGAWKATRGQQAKTLGGIGGVTVAVTKDAPPDMLAAAADDNKKGVVAAATSPTDPTKLIVPKS